MVTFVMFKWYELLHNKKSPANFGSPSLSYIKEIIRVSSQENMSLEFARMLGLTQSSKLLKLVRTLYSCTPDKDI